MNMAGSLNCDLMPAPRKGHCDWCGTKLRGRQTRWCGRTCAREFTANHRWTQAKAAAKKEHAYWRCANAWMTNSDEWIGPTDCLVFTQKPEVNHIEPIKGRHGQFGCHHHQSNLSVLCRPCHLKETARQRKEGKL